MSAYGQFLLFMALASFVSGFAGAYAFMALRDFSNARAEKQRRITAARARAKVDAWKAAPVAE